MHRSIKIVLCILVGVFVLWPCIIYMIGVYLASALFLILYPISFFDKDPLQRLYSWLTYPKDGWAWVFGWQLGIISELVHYFGWLCLRMLRGQQTNFADYMPLVLKVNLLLMSVPFAAANYHTAGYMALQSDREDDRLRQDRGNYQEKLTHFICAIFWHSFIMFTLPTAIFLVFALLKLMMGTEDLLLVLRIWLFSTLLFAGVAFAWRLATFHTLKYGIDAAEIGDSAQQGHTMLQWRRGATAVMNFWIH